MYQPEPQSMTFSTLIHDIDKGIIKIPQFQRDFVWSKDQSARLLDSIIKGYPIGTFILWETDERLRSIRNIGGAKLPNTPKGAKVQYVLDGQQRMTSLFASLNGLSIQREKKKENFEEIYVDLVAAQDESIIITNIDDRDEKEVIKLKDLLFGGISVLSKYPQSSYKILEDYQKRLNTYRFSTILLRDATIDVATEVFTRLNVGGKDLTVFEIMVAKTFDSERDFDLSEKYDEVKEKLEDVGFDTIPAIVFLQTMSVLQKRECAKKHILKLDRNEFINMWDDVVDAVERSVDYFRNYFRIPVSRLLPYNSLVVPFAYFFYHHPDKPEQEMKRYLEDFFWRVSLAERYSSSVETKIAQDVKRIDKILNGELPNYDFHVDVSKQAIIDNGWFSANRSYIKAILSLYAYQEPKSFNDHSIVRMNNGWLKQANSKNYHHFFPRAFLKKKGEEEFFINHILNITIVDDFLNKRKIRAQAPSKYMQTFKKDNDKLIETMQTHLINDIDNFGIWDDDYDTFFEKRAEVVSEELEKKIIN
ncbi:DUF262 domain-containing protein [Aquibacillus albus]|uniref:GmrSD restriction endonucleases N-terminal domain-containing protein n=1 Tax=Aquibacillus albus TaxID=1168171 RepID=A0ABS2N378_9BACI|nr:DUF262 domain-containing protein [Aquibacillus albus]MBM7572567.1 hypothetical protein [Aquibacillus albus]